MTDMQNVELLSRLDDLIRKSERGEVAFSQFLSPSDVRIATDHLARTGHKELCFLSGGFPDAERARVFLLPDYMLGACDKSGNLSADSAWYSELSDTVKSAVCIVEITGSGYRELSHRDYLGSILSLGIERDAVGDIALTGKFSSLAVTSAKMADFLSDELCKIASDTVKVRRLDVGELPDIKRELRPISDTVASGRLDCIVSALTSLSREKAQAAIKAGLVEIDYRRVCESDVQLSPPCTVTVRGHGKYILREFCGETKKGRLRISADKYV